MPRADNAGQSIMAACLVFRLVDWKGFCCNLFLRQTVDVLIQPLPVLRGHFNPQRVIDRTFQRFFPARTTVVHVSAASGGFTRGVQKDFCGCSDDADEFPFCQNRSAANAGPLWNVLYAFLRFLSHLSFFPFYSSHSQPPPRLCFFCTSVISRSGS